MSWFKKCSVCREGKILDDFYVQKSGRDGRTARCKQCQKQYYEDNKDRILEYQNAYRENNPEKYKATNKRYYNKNKAYWREYYYKNKGDNKGKNKEREQRLKERRAEEERSKEQWVYEKATEENLPEGQKRCRVCKEVKSEEEGFYKRKIGLYKSASQCKECADKEKEK